MRESGDVSLKRDSERERAAVDGSGRAQERYMAMSRLEEHTVGRRESPQVLLLHFSQQRDCSLVREATHNTHAQCLEVTTLGGPNTWCNCVSAPSGDVNGVAALYPRVDLPEREKLFRH